MVDSKENDKFDLGVKGLTVSRTVTLHSESAFIFLILFVSFVFPWSQEKPLDNLEWLRQNLSIQYHADTWWVWWKISTWGLSFDLTPNSQNKLYEVCMTDILIVKGFSKIGNFWEKNNINIFHKSIPFQ